MTIETKYDVNQTLFFMSDNKVASGFVERISATVITLDSKPAADLRTRTDVSYKLSGGVELSEFRLFPTKEALLATL